MNALVSRLRRRTQGEEGLALALALVFVLVVSLTVTALLPYTQAGLKTSTTVREVRTVNLAADGAIEEAMQSIRGSLVTGAEPSCGSAGPFPEYAAKDYPNPLPEGGTTKVKVAYCNTGSPTAAAGQPRYAIQTLGGGIDIDGNAPLVIAGGVLANGNVSAKGSQQSINIQGDLFAVGACTAKDLLYVSGLTRCSNTAKTYNATTDPNPTTDPFATLTPPALSTFSRVDPLGTCRTTGPSAAESVVVFKPGFYSENPRVDPVSCSGPKHTTWWFEPGQYYFDFPDSQFGFPDTAAAWSAPGVTLVGGEPLNWNPASSKSTDVQDLFKNDPDHGKPACDETKDGALFTFGGPTSIAVDAGGTTVSYLEICSAPYGTDGHRLSLWGVGNGTPRSTTPTKTTANPSAASSAQFLPPEATAEIDGTPGVAALVGGVTTSATSTVSGFGTFATSIPDGSIVKSVRLRANYWTTSPTGATTAAKVKPKLTYSSATLPATTASLAAVTTKPATESGEYVSVTLPTTQPSWRALKEALNGLTVSFVADGATLDALKVTGAGTTLAEEAVTNLDGVQLEVEFIAPAISPTRCTGTATGACNILTNKVTDAVFLHGTVYAPRSILEVAVHNYSTTVYERGVVAHSAVVHVNASTKQTLPPFQLPRGIADRIVRFTAMSQEPDGSWRDRAVALVQYEDFQRRPGGKTSAKAGHRLTVLRWTVVR